MPKFRDPVTLRHPKRPGEEIVKERRSVPFFAKSGWVEVKSSAASVAVETQQSPERDATPSKED